MSRNPPIDRVIYLALTNIFRGQDAQVRTAKKIRKLIQRHQNNPDLRECIFRRNTIRFWDPAWVERSLRGTVESLDWDL